MSSEYTGIIWPSDRGVTDDFYNEQVQRPVADDVWMTSTYTALDILTSIGQIQFVKTLLRLTYEAAVNGNHISVIGHPIIPFIQTHIVG